MSAIWGIVSLENNTQLLPGGRTTFEQTYRSSCKIDRYEGIEITDAYFGCGIQYITADAHKEYLPVYNKEKELLFTADCILDNRNEIISLLLSKGHSREELIETPDGGLMYLSFLEFGEDCVKDFRGLFSIAVWYETTRTLSIFSDPVSARSLYYTQADGLVAFSSRAEPLIKLFPVTPNENYYKDFLLSNTSVIYLVPGETPCKKKTTAFRSLLHRYTAHEGITPREFEHRILKRFQDYEQRPKEFLSTFVPENIFVTRSILRNYDLSKRHQADPRATVSGGFLCSNTYSDFLQATALLMYLGVFETQFGLSTGMLLRDPTKDIRMIDFCRQIPFSVFTYNGTPRQLIRSAFSHTLPKSILEPWEQHGILNADWSHRIKRDWQTLKPELLQHLDSDALENWIDKER